MGRCKQERNWPMTEILFIAEATAEGQWLARAVGADIFSEADDLHALRSNLRDAVSCHFESDVAPRMIRLRLVCEELLVA
jgi:hypothetical protein